MQWAYKTGKNHGNHRKLHKRDDVESSMTQREWKGIPGREEHEQINGNWKNEQCLRMEASPIGQNIKFIWRNKKW